MKLIRLAAILWASPYTLLGLLVGFIGLLTRGRMLKRWPLEFYGGGTSWLLARLPGGPLIAAMTLGHVIVGRSEDDLHRARDHEMVHVRQYERWGPLFGPAYLGASLWLWLRGKDAYRENPFEKEAYGD